MSEMVERVKGVLRGFDLDAAGGRLYEKELDLAARAAIGVMRNPTEEMIQNGAPLDHLDLNGYYRAKDIAKLVWAAMIDEAMR